MLILLILVELGTGSSIWLWGAGALYLVGRVLHALGMDGMMWGRMAGAIITMLTQLGLAIVALAAVYPTPPGIVATDAQATHTLAPTGPGSRPGLPTGDSTPSPWAARRPPGTSKTRQRR